MNDAPAPLIVHVVFRFDYGGLENGVANLVNGLHGRDWRHAIVALTEATRFGARVDPSVAVYALGKRPGKDPLAYLRLFRLLRTLKPAIVHTRNVGTLECALVAFLAGVPVRIHGEHGWDIHDPEGTRPKYRWLRRVFSPCVHVFVAVSEELRQWLLTAVGLPAARVERICNGVDTRRFEPADARAPQPMRSSAAAAPAELARTPAVLAPATAGLAPAPPRAPRGDRCRSSAADAVVIGSVTRFSAIKDPLNLVEAFIRLPRHAPVPRERLKLAMIGDGELHAAARARLEGAGAAEAAWLPGSLDDIPARLAGMDVFVLGSLREGISNTVLEAMAAGLPIVATAVGGNCELIVDGQCGFLVPPGDPDALAAAIARYVVDARLRAAHGQNARARAVAYFSLGVMRAGYLDLYTRLLTQGARRMAGV